MRTSKRGGDRGRYYSRYIAHYTKRNYAILALGLIFLAGVAFGALLMRSAQNETLAFLLKLVDGFVEKRRSQPLLANFSSSAGSSLGFLGALFVLGFCAIAQPAEILAPLFRGLGFGFSVATLYAQYGMSAAGFVALFMLPGTLLTTLAILFCTREAMRLSGSFLLCVREDAKEFYPVRVYIARFLVAGVVCVLAAFLEAALYAIFANYLVLG